MKADQILKADILDIIFEHKNKNYGAYALRKYYSERIYKALGIIFITALIFALIGFLYKHESAIIPGSIDETALAKIFEIPVTEAIVPEPPKPLQKHIAPVAEVNSPSGQVPVIADHASPIAQVPVDAGHADLSGPAGTGNSGDVPDDGRSAPPAAVTPSVPEPPAIDRNIPVHTADVLPSFPGGIEALKKFLKKHLAPPKETESDEIVSVTVQFVVGYDGSLKSFVITEDGGTEFNNEVIRVIKKMPAWIPGKSRGENVSVYYSIPVKFMPVN